MARPHLLHLPGAGHSYCFLSIIAPRSVADGAGDSAGGTMNRTGFTLIELLIVVVIIGLLAAIAIPKFANTKEKAYIASMKSDLHNLMTAEESYFADSLQYTD